MAHNIRDEIVEQRRRRIAQLGHSEGADVPATRQVPLTPFLPERGLICEVKRRSPSKGDIAPGLDAAAQAGLYAGAGVQTFSVLTVPEGFGGSIEDLMAVKQAYPQAAVLRKDFLFDPEDVEVAYRAGADAVLLIAGMLPEERIRLLYRTAKKLGMEALVEIHDQDDVDKVKGFTPDLVGINSRDLKTFAIDPLLPLRVRAGIDWKARVVYESGVSAPDQAAFVASSGFHGLLIGEAVVKDPALPRRLSEAMRAAVAARFWPEVGRRLAAAGARPLVKICGLTREEDVRLAAECGADMLGFVFHPASPRRADPDLPRRLGDIAALKVGVVVNRAGAEGLPDAVVRLLRDGFLDAVQLHGEETPDDCFRLWPISYKALKPRSRNDLALEAQYRCPRVLLDAAADVPGGSGKRIDDAILDARGGPLWLAGGITPDNAAAIAAARRPELMDAASGVEDAPGIKNAEKVRKLIKEIRNA